MKNSKDYIRDDGPGRSTITSLAYLLTPEGLNPITAAMVCETIQSASDDDFREAFDGATKDKARKILAAYELCAMPYWGADELATAIHDADNGRDEKLALRAVSLAQKVGELPDFFKPRQGVEWAMDRGYLFGIHARFLGASPGSYGHPHNPLNEGPHHKQTASTTDTETPPPVVAESASGNDEWKAKVKVRAAEIIERQRKRDCYPSQIAIADEIAKEFRAAGIVGADSKPLSGAYIKRHALAGISSAQGERLSTSIRRGK